jgi:hypothetical protein
MTDRPTGGPEVPSNPFATRFIRPGALPFLFDDDQSLETLERRLKANHWLGEIVGPHGSGKSTLLAALVPKLAAGGAHVTLYRLQGGMRSLPRPDSPAVEWFPPAGETPRSKIAARILIVDGAEQLSTLRWWQLRGMVWFFRLGLIVTTHRTLGLPRLVSTSSSPELTWRIVERLVPAHAETISRSEVDAAFARCGGNTRETLLSLFDVYQRRQAGQASA